MLLFSPKGIRIPVQGKQVFERRPGLRLRELWVPCRGTGVFGKKIHEAEIIFEIFSNLYRVFCYNFLSLLDTISRRHVRFFTQLSDKI